jgi:Protein of unknown function (DUF1573)
VNEAMNATATGSRIRFRCGAALAACCALASLGVGFACKPSSASASVAADSLAVEPATLDMGDLVPDQTVTKRVKLTNHSAKPIKITNAVADCSCTTPTWPTEPIAPGATVETDISIKPGPKQGVTLTKRVTFSLEDGDPVFLTVVGKVGLFIEQSDETLRGPSDDVADPGTSTVTFKSADKVAFKIDGVDPSCASAGSKDAGLEHTVTIDWKKWRELKKPTKLTVLTNHPKVPELVIMMRRSTATKPTTPTAPKAAEGE